MTEFPAPTGYGHRAPGGQEGDGGDEQTEAIGGAHPAELGEQPGKGVADADPDDGDHRELGDGGRAALLWEMVAGHAIISAVRPSPTPWAALPVSSHANGSGSTVSALPATTTASVARIVARRCGPAPSRPRTGVATAPLSSAMVSVHCALSSETWYVVATLVMSGVPRLATAATTRAMNIREGTSRRASECSRLVLIGWSRP